MKGQGRMARRKLGFYEESLETDVELIDLKDWFINQCAQAASVLQDCFPEWFEQALQKGREKRNKRLRYRFVLMEHGIEPDDIELKKAKHGITKQGLKKKGI
jgi:hypothetical protein